MVSRFFGVCLALGVVGCGNPPSARTSDERKSEPKTLAVTPVARDAEPPLADMRTGALVPEHASAPLEIAPVASYAGPEFETLKFEFVGVPDVVIETVDVVHVPGAVSAFTTSVTSDGGTLWVRRPIARTKEPVSGEIYTGAKDGRPGVRYSLRVKSGAPAAKLGTKALEGEWLDVFAWVNDPLVLYWSSPFSPFLARRAREMREKQYGPPHDRSLTPPPFARSASLDLHQLMQTTTGRSAIQRAIQHEKPLVATISREPKKLPLAAAPAPNIPRADYAAMLAALGRQPPTEPLAQAAPADFWFFRARTFQAFYELFELVESWGQPAADLLGGQTEDRGTTARYQAELALERTELARVLGPSVIESLAVVGSDPYVHDGTDVTFVFKVTSAPLFEASLAKALARYGDAHGGVTKSELIHEGVTIRAARSADGRVRQHRASVAGLELVSNSPAAIRRVISAALGKAPRLADEADFRYLTARDADTPDEIMAFLSDRFVLNVVGPAQKIGQARRQLALGELSTPGFAALLFGWINGRSPKDEKELIRDGELLASELKHSDGSPITFRPGEPARSRWGTTTALEPLIDLPRVEKISAGEQRGYRVFAEDYSRLWSEYVDPVIVRFARAKGAAKRIDVAIRALPLLRADNRELIQMVGSASVDVPPLDTGLRGVFALGKDAELRQALDGRARFGGNSLKFDWLGDSVTVGLADRAELTHAAQPGMRRKLEVPSAESMRPGDELEALADLPIYAIVEVKNRVGAVVALGTVRTMASDVAREMLEWRDGGKYRDVSITDVAILPSGMLREGGHMYYALCPNALVVSLNRAVIEKLIDDQLDGKAPRGTTDPKMKGKKGQFVIELGTKKDGALVRTLGWVATAALVSEPESQVSAEAILRGAPESRASADAFRALARAYLGYVPLTPDGNLLQYFPEGIRDPERGTLHAPIFPKSPLPGSPLAMVLERFARIRSEISFDAEPGMTRRDQDVRSFSARFSLELR